MDHTGLPNFRSRVLTVYLCVSHPFRLLHCSGCCTSLPRWHSTVPICCLVDSPEGLVGPASPSDVTGDDLLTGGDDLLGSGGNLLGSDPVDPLSNLGPAPSDVPSVQPEQKKDPHEDLWTENCYPSAETCRKCHPSQYEQWRASGHAYASVSPMFQRFEQAMTEYTRGTVGSFCVPLPFARRDSVECTTFIECVRRATGCSRRRYVHRMPSCQRTLLAQQR